MKNNEPAGVHFYYKHIIADPNQLGDLIKTFEDNNPDILIMERTPIDDNNIMLRFCKKAELEAAKRREEQQKQAEIKRQQELEESRPEKDPFDGKNYDQVRVSELRQELERIKKTGNELETELAQARLRDAMIAKENNIKRQAYMDRPKNIPKKDSNLAPDPDEATYYDIQNMTQEEKDYIKKRKENGIGKGHLFVDENGNFLMKPNAKDLNEIPKHNPREEDRKNLNNWFMRWGKELEYFNSQQEPRFRVNVEGAIERKKFSIGKCAKAAQEQDTLALVAKLREVYQESGNDYRPLFPETKKYFNREPLRSYKDIDELDRVVSSERMFWESVVEPKKTTPDELRAFETFVNSAKDDNDDYMP